MLLADQDRSRWDAARSPLGAGLARAFALHGHGVYVMQAAIASLHMEARSTGRRSPRSTASWSRLTGSPVVKLNRAIAVAEAAGTEAGLTLVDRLDLDGYPYFHSTRADLLRASAEPTRPDRVRRALELATPSPSAGSCCGASLKSPHSETAG